jgi:hypothetical protein
VLGAPQNLDDLHPTATATAVAIIRAKSAIWPRPSARRATYSDSYASNQYRALQQFFRWWVGEEELPDPMAKLHPPKVIQCDWLQAAGPGP